MNGAASASIFHKFWMTPWFGSLTVISFLSLLLLLLSPHLCEATCQLATAAMSVFYYKKHLTFFSAGSIENLHLESPSAALMPSSCCSPTYSNAREHSGTDPHSTTNQHREGGWPSLRLLWWLPQAAEWAHLHLLEHLCVTFTTQNGSDSMCVWALTWHIAAPAVVTTLPPWPCSCPLTFTAPLRPSLWTGKG